MTGGTIVVGDTTREKCPKSNQECKYDHRCKFCAMFNHGWHICRKRLNRGSGGGQSKPNAPSTSFVPTTSSEQNDKKQN